VGNSSLMLFKLEEAAGGRAPIHVPWLYVDDVEAHQRRAERHGARIVKKLDSPWGLPFYIADDPEGNRWTIVQARPTMT
jgi:uncharacterized glyoxalase superfamily protein PhnB